MVGSRWMMTGASIALLSSLLGQVASVTAQDRGSDASGPRFLREAPLEWAKYGARFNGCVMTVRGEWRGDDGSKPLRWSYSTAIAKDAVGFLQEGLESNTVDKDGLRVTGANPKYSFTLQRSGPNKEWYIDDVGANGTRTDIRTVTEHHRTINVGGLRLIDEILLPTIVTDPAFHIKSASTGEVSGHELVHVDFEYRSADLSLTGTLTLSPRQAWLLREAEFVATRGPEGRRCHVVNTIEDRDGVPFVTRMVSDTYANDGGHWKETREFEVTQKDVSHDLFLLSHFGFPEPEFQAPGRTRIQITLAVFSALAVLAFVMSRWRRKDPSKPAVPNTG